MPLKQEAIIFADNEHNIVFDWESVIERTLRQQFPALVPVNPEDVKEDNKGGKRRLVIEEDEGGGIKRRKREEEQTDFEEWINGNIMH